MFLYNIILFIFWLQHVACGILVPQPEIKPTPTALKCGVLTTAPPGKSLSRTFLREKSVLMFENNSWR